ncbi:hypothetical protein [Burkholderia pyrrocinia]|uniref:hypothetical protein n=1 Tax=Burkholderia pyrrocinia TaxID=60550 RepID=UPI00158A0EE0|nr:hypothetical protein [Burkholderia pyrrocinia]
MALAGAANAALAADANCAKKGPFPEDTGPADVTIRLGPFAATHPTRKTAASVEIDNTPARRVSPLNPASRSLRMVYPYFYLTMSFSNAREIVLLVNLLAGSRNEYFYEFSKIVN